MFLMTLLYVDQPVGRQCYAVFGLPQTYSQHHVVKLDNVQEKFYIWLRMSCYTTGWFWCSEIFIGFLMVQI